MTLLLQYHLFSLQSALKVLKIFNPGRKNKRKTAIAIERSSSNKQINNSMNEDDFTNIDNFFDSEGPFRRRARTYTDGGK